MHLPSEDAKRKQLSNLLQALSEKKKGAKVIARQKTPKATYVPPWIFWQEGGTKGPRGKITIQLQLVKTQPFSPVAEREQLGRIPLGACKESHEKIRAGDEHFAGRGIDHLTYSGSAIDAAWRCGACHNESKSDQEYRTTTGFVNAPRSGRRRGNVYNIIGEVRTMDLATLKICCFVVQSFN